jgi:CheY-like chemotaxis protein
MKRILIIEDNLDIRENSTELLELLGYSVIAASNGQMGVDMAKAELPDMILSDIMMPYLNGHEVFDILKSDPATKNIPFVFVTSSVERKEIEAAVEKGAYGYIKKPFEEKELMEVIQLCLFGDISE